MQTYIIKETQNAQSEREGTAIQAASLTAAKRHASRNQFYQGTVLKIEAESGALLAIKDGKTWQDF